MTIEIRVLTLNDNDHEDSTLYRLKKGWILRFRLGPSLFGRELQVWTNHPEDSQGSHDRHKFRLLSWKCDSSNKDDDTAIFTDINIVIAGPFQYYYTLKDNPNDRRGSGYFMVDPVLIYGKDEVLPLDGVQCKTYLSKCLGRFEEWENRLKVAMESGYNIIHFTPIQTLGGSQSSYSLSDQLSLNPNFSSDDKKYTLDDVEKLTKKMRDEWKVLSICDIVLNHSANESEWLHEHPECAYNLENSPHLRPAYVLDRLLWHFTIEISEGKWISSGIPPNINQYEQLNNVRAALNGYFLPQVKIIEYYLADVNKIVKEFYKKLQDLPPGNGSSEELKLIQDPFYDRFGCTIDIEKAISIYNIHHGGCDEDDRQQRCCRQFRQKLESLNEESCRLVQIHLRAAVDNVIAAMDYERIQEHGPRISEVSRKNPLVPNYFTHHGPEESLQEEAILAFSTDCKYIMAHNGWVMGDDPLRNFAEASSNVYLRRELIAWGDSVKLRYGDKPEDCPYLWQHMKNYTVQTAKIFHGIRLDNCHSTPLHAAEYMIDAARKIRPDLYVVAELFTSSEGIDNIFVNHLGINSLIREAMSAHDSHEEGRLVYRYGGEPVGAFLQGICRPLTPSIAHALLFDLTHDNPSPIQKRSVYDLFPSAALVSMASCGTGSSFGYDELVPHHVHVVNEVRHFPSWSEKQVCHSSTIGSHSALIAGKKLLNDLHFQLGKEGFTEVFVDQVDKDIVTVTRHCPKTHRSVILVAFTAFSVPFNIREKRWIKPLTISGVVNEIIFESRLNEVEVSAGFEKDEKYVNGLLGYSMEIRRNIQLADSQFVRLAKSTVDDGRNLQEIEFSQFYPGSVIAFRVSLDPPSLTAISELRKRFEETSAHEIQSDLRKILDRLNLTSINRILFRCDNEERDEGKGFGVYEIDSSTISYCGLQGVMTLLSDIRPRNDLGHPLCGNLRDGNWLLDYISNRLKVDESTQELGLWFEEVFSLLKLIPRYLVPRYFDTVITYVYSLILDQIWKRMDKFVSDGSVFVRFLALGSVILGGVVHSAPLPNLSPNLLPPLPPTTIDPDTGNVRQSCTTLSAGLPHFSTGYMRNWGRDTFIALKGLLLITGRHVEARFIILGFAGCLRHGLIPNLLDGGHNARFNCRDAVWWWLQSILDYVKIVPDGHKILEDKVLRLFPTDKSQAYAGSVENKLEDVIFEALQRHVVGVKFRERNAGYNLDREMSDAGFNNEIGVDLNTGFVFGGNVSNCGTWMDKMGSSERAGTKGKPATPRDGSAVEIVGLSRSVLNGLLQLQRDGKFSYSSFDTNNGESMSFEEWLYLIDNHFEKCFWIPSNISETVNDEHPDLINHKGIYKDTYKSSVTWTDYQFRCNFPIAIALAPEMVNAEHAWIALEEAEKCLLGPLGMKTLSDE
ncbi:hypothetical protein CHUAL_011301 [Chamberlinius hualienensis]